MSKKLKTGKYEILVDIDFKPDVHKFCNDLVEKMTFLHRYMGIVFKELKVYETAKGYHLYFGADSAEELTPMDIVFIQLALGSDYKREVFNWRRVKGWLEGDELSPGWNTLFMVKYRGGKVVSIEQKTFNAKVIEKTVMHIYRKRAEKIKCGR